MHKWAQGHVMLFVMCLVWLYSSVNSFLMKQDISGTSKISRTYFFSELIQLLTLIQKNTFTFYLQLTFELHITSYLHCSKTTKSKNTSTYTPEYSYILYSIKVLLRTNMIHVYHGIQCCQTVIQHMCHCAFIGGLTNYILTHV